ncbi:MFS transporter [Actinomadura alba]|uniref:MFS transporter n=1 Tax=Actinomadura alba TaxID=406431 RepID=A0ABR7M2S9_9ACTN|nr:MFS transporter [Actinomadura alba]MBC6471119.1 MFS transporter [Actinomadura alba]
MSSRIRSFDRSVQLLLINQLTINTGFYMLMPYLAGHLATDLGMAAWTIGLVLGVRNLSQQGLFLVGGTLADRLGYKPVIVAGCALRTGGFALLGVVDALPALLVASAATGFAGALFNPAVRAYLAQDAADRRLEAFAVFNVFCQAGILGGPLIGLALMATGAFRMVCLVAAMIFAVLTVVQLRWLPPRRPVAVPASTILADWRVVIGNRSFVLFSMAMAGSCVLSFQIYLLLPLMLQRQMGGQVGGALGGVSLIFTVSAITAIAGQLRITDAARRRWDGPAAMTRGVLIMAGSFLPLAGYGLAGPEVAGPAVLLAAVVLCTLLLTIGTALSYPFEMDTVVNLSRGGLVATHYGLYNTVAGIGIAAGNLLGGALLDASGEGPVPWIALSVLGGICGWAVRRLATAGRLSTDERGPTVHTALAQRRT